METIKGKRITSVGELVKGKKYWIDYVGESWHGEESRVMLFTDGYFVDDDDCKLGKYYELETYFNQEYEFRINVYEWIELEVGKKYNVKYIGKDWKEYRKGNVTDEIVVKTFKEDYIFNFIFEEENGFFMTLNDVRKYMSEPYELKDKKLDLAIEISEYIEPHISISPSEFPQSIKSINIERNGDKPDTYSVVLNTDTETNELPYCGIDFSNAKYGTINIQIRLSDYVKGWE